MADKKETKKEVVGPPIRSGDPRLSVKSQEMKEKAFGMVKGDLGKWNIVTLVYDLESKSAKIDAVEEFEDRYTAFNKFRVKVASEF